VRHISQNVIARDKVLYDGHALAAVAATSPHIAEEALRLIEVDYEVLQPVMTLDDAMKPDAVVVFSGGGRDGSPNIADHLQIERGDIDAGFKAADYIVEREFRSSPVHQGYIEPHNALAIYNSDGYVTIYCSTQGQFIIRTLTAALLGMPEGNVRVIPAEIGGGFGGKTTTYLEPIAALLSKKTGRPVKMVMTRSEVLRASGPTSGTKIRAKIGATRDGKILWDYDTARKFDTVNGVAANGGALDGPGPAVAGGMLVVNSGYGYFNGIPGNVLLAFGVE